MPHRFRPGLRQRVVPPLAFIQRHRQRPRNGLPDRLGVVRVDEERRFAFHRGTRESRQEGRTARSSRAAMPDVAAPAVPARRGPSTPRTGAPPRTPPGWKDTALARRTCELLVRPAYRDIRLSLLRDAGARRLRQDGSTSVDDRLAASRTRAEEQAGWRAQTARTPRRSIPPIRSARSGLPKALDFSAGAKISRSTMRGDPGVSPSRLPGFLMCINGDRAGLFLICINLARSAVS